MQKSLEQFKHEAHYQSIYYFIKGKGAQVLRCHLAKLTQRVSNLQFESER